MSLETSTNFENFPERFLKTKKANRLVYEKLVPTKQQRPSRSQEKWSVDCEAPLAESQFTDCLSHTKITKLITFQFKLLHRLLATNDFLKKIGIKAYVLQNRDRELNSPILVL